MIRAWLLVLQLPLLFIPGLFLGLVTYGSNFNVLAGEIYIGLLVGLPLLAAFISRRSRIVIRPVQELVLLVLTAAVLAWIYQPLHMGYWDEASTFQAALLAAAATLLLLTSQIGVARLVQQPGNSALPLAAAIICCAAAWLPSLAFPLFPLLACALINLLALTMPALNTVQKVAASSRPGKWTGYALFLIATEFFLVALDYQGDTRWAWHVALGLAAAAGGALIRPGALQAAVAVLAIAVALAACLIPEFVLSPWHSVAIGTCLGWLIHRRVLGENGMPQSLQSVLFAWIGGLLVAQLFYSNLLFVQWRAVLLLPLLWWLLPIAAGRNTQPG